MNVFHFTAAQTFSEAYRLSPVSPVGSHFVLFAPEIDWAPTCFTKDNRGRWRAVAREEMLCPGIRRFGVAARELPLLSQLPLEQMRGLDPLLDVLAMLGVEPVGWRGDDGPPIHRGPNPRYLPKRALGARYRGPLERRQAAGAAASAAAVGGSSPALQAPL